MEIKVVYIDDILDVELSRYLERSLCNDLKRLGVNDVDIRACEIEYEEASGFEALLSDPRLTQANIAIIDSKLFSNATTDKGMLTGEEFRIILRKRFPFIESLVITQIDERRVEGQGILAKYDLISNEGMTPDEFYRNQLAPEIERLIANIRAFRAASEKLSADVVDEVTLEKIRNSVQGISKYDELTKDDIDHVVEHFKTIEKLITDAER